MGVTVWTVYSAHTASMQNLFYLVVFLLYTITSLPNHSSIYSSSLPGSGLSPYLSSLPPQGYPTPKRPISSYSSLPDCAEGYSEPISNPVCGSYARNCTVVVESQYTIQYKEECGRKYRKVCQEAAQSDCKAVIDPGCYQVPTHTPVEVPREVCYNPTGEKCDRYPRRVGHSVPYSDCK